MTKADEVLKRLEDAAREAPKEVPLVFDYGPECAYIPYQKKIFTSRHRMSREYAEAIVRYLSLANAATILALIDDRKALLEALHGYARTIADPISGPAIKAILASEARIAKLGDGE